MGQIIKLPPIGKNIPSNKLNNKKTNRDKYAKKNQHKNVDGIGAEILFFTGVRYERLDECASIPVK